MKRSIVGIWFAILMFAIVMMGCVSVPKPAPKPTLPLELMYLSMSLGEPEIIEVYAVIAQWTIDGVLYELALIYDPILEIWYAYPYGSGGAVEELADVSY